MMSFFDHQGIPEQLAQPDHGNEQNNSLPDRTNDGSDASSEGSVDDAFETDIDTLRDYSFISVRPGGGSFEMHRWCSLQRMCGRKRRSNMRCGKRTASKGWMCSSPTLLMSYGRNVVLCSHTRHLYSSRRRRSRMHYYLWPPFCTKQGGLHLNKAYLLKRK